MLGYFCQATPGAHPLPALGGHLPARPRGSTGPLYSLPSELPWPVPLDSEPAHRPEHPSPKTRMSLVPKNSRCPIRSTSTV